MDNTKHKRLFVISNMYPSSEHPSYGIFVRNFIDFFNSHDEISIEESVLLKKKSNLFVKFFAYWCFYFEILYKGLFFKYDIIYVHFISHSAFPISLLKLLRPKKKLILNTHGSDVISKSRLFWIYLFFMRFLFNKASLIVVPSQSFKKEIYRLTTPRNFHKVTHSYSCGVDTLKFCPKTNKNFLGNSFNVGFVSRITREKGWQVLLEAISLLKQSGEIKEFKVTIAGNGIELDAARKRVFHLGIEDKITFLGELNQEELPNLYNNFDVLIFPTFRESLGLVGIESLACGVPVIASRIEGVQEYMKDGQNGFLFQTGNAVDLYEKILKFYNLEQTDKSNMKENARLTAERFDKLIVLNDLALKIE
jgi:glycosyltransferase involved in cell wall biosynthesis